MAANGNSEAAKLRTALEELDQEIAIRVDELNRLKAKRQQYRSALEAIAEVAEIAERSVAEFALRPGVAPGKATLGEKILQCLELGPEHGLTTEEIMSALEERYGQRFKPNSVRSTLTRLNHVSVAHFDGRWILPEEGGS
jgi:uncharacterized small protein (DUF1192 family)